MAPSKEIAKIGTTALAPLDNVQTLKASKALLAHIKKGVSEKRTESSKKNLLGDEDDVADTPVWLTLTTKKYLAKTKSLKPRKIKVPHALNTDETLSICLITADPQSFYRDTVDSEKFPVELRKKIGRVIDFSHLKKEFKQYEAQRKLYSEHDVFMGDDRIVDQLPKWLGNTFYKTTQKRPIPVELQSKVPRVNGGKRGKRTKTEGEVSAASPEKMAKEIQKALGSVLLNIGPSVETAIRIGYASWDADHIAENVEAVANDVIQKWVPEQWQGVRSIHIKGPATTALPIFMTDELWADAEKDVIADEDPEAKTEKANVGKKRKSVSGADEAEASPAAKKVKKADKKAKTKTEDGDDAVLDQHIADRKAKLRKQKAASRKSMDA